MFIHQQGSSKHFKAVLYADGESKTRNYMGIVLSEA
jgi:hypothetical protein